MQGLNDEIYVLTERAAMNLSYQEKMPVRGAPQCLLPLTGQDLIGTPVRSPQCPHDRVYVLPLLTILTNKGTGVVTSVPSDSPDDYMALCDLKKKPKLREKYGVCDEWVLPFEVRVCWGSKEQGYQPLRTFMASESDAVSNFAVTFFPCYFP